MWLNHRILLLSAICIFLNSCVTGKGGGAVDNNNLSAEEKKELQAQLSEVEVGRNMAGRLVTYYGVVEDEDLVNYVNQVGNYVASYSEFENRRFMFHILNSEAYNAFAAPGGYIFISVGALRLAKNEAELAMILGHEITHVGKRHMINTIGSMTEKERESAAERVNKIDGMPESVRVRMRPVPEQSNVDIDNVLHMLGGSGAAAFGVVKSASAGMAVMLEQGMDHKYEFEADRLGVKYAIRAGYAPQALVRFFKRLSKAKGVDASIMSKTHPSTAERIAQLNILFKEIDADNIVGALGKPRYDKYMKKLPSKKKS